jgi:hypothetical protein
MMLGFLLGAALAGAPVAEHPFPCNSAGDLAAVISELEQGRCPPLCWLNDGDIMRLSHQAFTCSGGYNQWPTMDAQLLQVAYSYSGHQLAQGHYYSIRAHCRHHGCFGDR